MPICARCLSNSRVRHLAKTIVETFAHESKEFSLRTARVSLSGLKIFETQSDGAIQWALDGLPGYVCSEYIDDVPSGKYGPNGILCQDLHALSFPDDTFDLVITQDVLEHVRHPGRAISEIRRVLKPGRYHIFTVPMVLTREETIPLVDVSGEEDRFLVPPVYHLDSMRLKGTLVYNDFGKDFLEKIDSSGMQTRILFSTQVDEREYRIFHSTVFISRKVQHPRNRS
jgi:SAM-dependent methyltransferase